MSKKVKNKIKQNKLDFLKHVTAKIKVVSEIDYSTFFGKSLAKQTFIGLIGYQNQKFIFVQGSHDFHSVVKKITTIMFPKILKIKNIKQNTKS